MNGSMSEYEVTFAVPAITTLDDERVVQLETELEAFVSTTRAGAEATVSCVGVSAATAGRAMAAQLRGLGVEPSRTLPDLVSPSEISRRTGVTRQAVSSWIHQTRGSGGFPMPHWPADRGLWLWGEVKPWLNEHGYALDDRLSYPTSSDHTMIDYHLLTPADVAPAPTSSPTVHVAFVNRAAGTFSNAVGAGELPRPDRMIHVSTVAAHRIFSAASPPEASFEVPNQLLRRGIRR